MSKMTITMADGAVWDYDPLYGDVDEIEIVVTEAADGMEIALDGVGGAEEIRKGSRALSTPAASKVLTARRAEPVRLKGSLVGMVARVR